MSLLRFRFGKTPIAKAIGPELYWTDHLEICKKNSCRSIFYHKTKKRNTTNGRHAKRRNNVELDFAQNHDQVI